MKAEHRQPLGAATVDASENWTVVGSSKTGKTFFLYSALQRSEFSERLTLTPDKDTHRLLADRLQEHLDDGIPGGTFALHTYTISMAEKLAAGTSRARTVKVIDGPGGDILPSLQQSRNAQPTQISTDFRNAVNASQCLLLFLPHPTPSQNPDMEWINRVKVFLQSLKPISIPGLCRIALCISKVDRAEGFSDVIGKPGTIIEFTHAVYDNADPTHAALNCLKKISDDFPDLQVGFFPVSSFGTVQATSHRNLMPHNDRDLPIIHEKPLDSFGRYAIPLCPRPFTGPEVNQLWQPFNIHAPFEFLLTGEIPDETGISLSDFKNA